MNKMEINNFDLIKNTFYFNENDNMFYHCQIISRKKDLNNSKNQLHKIYFIKSAEHLDNLKNEIILLCKHYNARAYINISGKNFNKLNSMLLLQLVTNINNDVILNPFKLLHSCAGKLKSDTIRWIIDIDDLSIKDDVINYINKENNNSIIYEIPTVHGVHLISKFKFNTKLFKEHFPNIDIHKNNPTLLYYNL